MKWNILKILLVVPFLFFSACTSINNNDVCPDITIPGFYSFQTGTLTNALNTSQVYNLNEIGASGFLQVNSNASATLTIYTPGADITNPQTLTGTWANSGTQLVVTLQGGVTLTGSFTQDFTTCVVSYNASSNSAVPISVTVGTQSISATLQVLFQQYTQNIAASTLANSYKSYVLGAFENSDSTVTANRQGSTPDTLIFSSDGTYSAVLNNETPVASDAGTFSISNNYTLVTNSTMGGGVTTYIYSYNQISTYLTLIDYNGTYDFGTGEVSATLYNVYQPQN